MIFFYNNNKSRQSHHRSDKIDEIMTRFDQIMITLNIHHRTDEERKIGFAVSFHNQTMLIHLLLPRHFNSFAA